MHNIERMQKLDRAQRIVHNRDDMLLIERHGFRLLKDSFQVLIDMLHDDE